MNETVMQSSNRRRTRVSLLALTFLCQLLSTTVVAPRPTYARVDPLNVIVRQLHKPNMLILLDTSGSLTGVPGGSFDYTDEVGVDCDEGVNCRGGLSSGTCAAAAKTCTFDSQCRTSTCKTGGAGCSTDSDCTLVPGRCETGHTCYATADCPEQTSGTCAVSGANCSVSKKCTQQLRCTRNGIACAADNDCDPGICADNSTTCASSAECPYASSGGTCAWGTTPSGGCRINSDCPLRAKVCSTNTSKTCSSVNDCGGVCKKSGASCASNNDCKTKPGDSCDFTGRSCSAPTNTCMLPRQTCTIRYTDNRCVDQNPCVPTANPCTGVTVNRCLSGVPGDVCNASGTATGSRMCRIGQNKCDQNSDCNISGDSCGPATSRMVISKRVIRNIVAANANVVNLGLMTFFQAGYFPYYVVGGTTTTSTEAVDIKQGTLQSSGCYSKRTGLATTCTVNGKSYNLKSGKNARYLVKGHGGDGDKYVDAAYCGWFCNIDGVGTGVFKGGYYEYLDVKGTPGELKTFDTYRGKVFTENGVTYRYYDSRPDYYNGGASPPITVPSCGSSCSASCGGRWDSQLAPFLTTNDSTTNLNATITAFNQALEPANYGGLIAYGGTPTGCSLMNPNVPDRNHSAYHYMQEVKAQDSLQCRLNYVLLITDGEANGPGDSNCHYSACAADDPVAAGCTCRAVLSAYSLRKNLNVRTIVVGFSTDVTTGNGFKTNDNIARAGGTDVGNDGRSPYAYGATSERALNQAIQDAIYSAVQGSYATSPSTASQGSQQGTSYASGDLILDSRVDFPSWRGHLIAYDVSGDRPVLKWDAATKLESMDWKRRKVFTSDGERLILIDIDQSTGMIRNRDLLFTLGLGGNIDEAERIARWMLGDPELKNPAVLGAIVNSTPIDVGPPIDGPLPGQGRFNEAQKDRPAITYVGSNDGMLHAFYTRTQTIGGATYEGGAEAFAFLPPNMMPAVTKLYAQGGQLADPRQHIYGGLANSPKAKNMCVANCDSDTGAVWKTLLVATQGWGGNEVFMLDITTPMYGPQLYWSSIKQGWPAAYDRALGLTVSVPAFTFHRTDGQDDYRLLLASGYPLQEGSTTQGRTFLSVSVTEGTVKDEEVLPGSGWCPQEYTLLSDVATSRKQFKNQLGVNDGRKEFLTAYLGDTWGKLWRYGPDAELVADFGCQQPLHYSPTVVQLDADDPNNAAGGDTYLVQVTNSPLDDDTKGFEPSKMIILKEANDSGRPTLDTSFGTNGRVELTAGDTRQLCAETDISGENCLTPVPSHTRPLSTPMAVPKADGTGFFILSNWYAPAIDGCGKGATYFMVHEFGGDTVRLKQAIKVAEEPVLSPVVVSGRLMVSSSGGPVNIDGSVTTNMVSTRPATDHEGDLFEMGGWSEVQ
jgi:hypothetical protein